MRSLTVPILPRPVRIHYLRPPGRLTVYRQTLVHDDGRVKVTLAEDVRLPEPLVLRGDTVLESGAAAVWFTFPGVWHDIGRFHRADDRLTGIYANVITPCHFAPGGVWRTTDLFLDVWIPAKGGAAESAEAGVEDQAELEEALRTGLIDRWLARRARQEAEEIMTAIQADRWPPPVVRRWTLERARAAAGIPAVKEGR